METHIRNSPVEEDLGAKRRASSDEWTTSKKRALNSRTGSPVPANGTTEEENKSSSSNNFNEREPEKEDDLERFRKAAIFRRMRYYQRECARSHERIGKLEESLRLANLERINAESCWNSTMETIRRLLQLDAVMAEVGDNLKPCFPSRIFSPEDFKKSRKTSDERMRAAEKAINAFIRFAGKVDRPKYEELLSECQSLQQSNSFLTAEAERTYALLESAQRERDAYLEELRIAQAKVDRLQSRTVSPALENEADDHVTPKVNGDVQVDRDSDGREASPSAATSLANIVAQLVLPDESVWDARVQMRDERIAQLEQENAVLRDKLVWIDSELKLLGEDTIMKTPTYCVLLEYASKIEALLKEERQNTAKARGEAKKILEEVRTSWHDEMKAYKEEEIEQLKSLLRKRDDDLIRIRQHRDQLETQNKELKTISDNRRSSLAKYKDLAESREERIELLSSEVKRLKSRMAAAAGDVDLLKFIQNDANADKNYVDDLKERLNATQRELDSLRETLKGNEKHLAEVAILRTNLGVVTGQLDTYKRSAESGLIDQIKAKDEELRVLRLKESQSTQEMTELFSEMDRLHKAWETANKQAEAQVTSLDKWEEEREKISVAKQKAENKFFKVMGEMDAKDAERKLALRHVERQARQIEFHERHQKELQALNESLQSELLILKEELPALQTNADLVAKARYDNNIVSSERSQREILLHEQIQNREKQLADMNIAMLKLRDELTKKTKEAEKAFERIKTLSTRTAPASEREAELQEEVNNAMAVLKCSTCKTNFRNTVLLKCMHTFCKQCVDARISHRTRKCPYCNIPFSQSEIQSFYVQ